jgi:phospholipase C
MKTSNGCQLLLERLEERTLLSVAQLQLISSTTYPGIGAPFTLQVTAEDANGNLVSSYQGTVHFTSTDSHMVLPPDYTFTASDNGEHSFVGALTANSVGPQTLSAADTVVSSVTGTIGVTVEPAPVGNFIKHVIIIMQENRSFDTYFGTYPGADGIPMQNGAPTVSVYNPFTNTYVQPYHNPLDANNGGGHALSNAVADIDGGKMDGFLAQSNGSLDVMGYHDNREIPNYWGYAQNFVLQDHMFEPTLSWSQPSHVYLVSNWSAQCSDPNDAMT